MNGGVRILEDLFDGLHISGISLDPVHLITIINHNNQDDSGVTVRRTHLKQIPRRLRKCTYPGELLRVRLGIHTPPRNGCHIMTTFY